MSSTVLTRRPTWYTASLRQDAVNYGWLRQQYKGYLPALLCVAYNVTGDAKYLESIRLEYKLAVTPGYIPDRTFDSKSAPGPAKVDAPAGSEK